ncbi:MAG: carboxylate--amine ligase, partial [Planctomycetota bacterium]
MLIPDSDDPNAIKVLRCLGQVRHVTTHILSKSRFSTERFSRHCARCHHHRSISDEDWINAISSVVQRWNIDVVLPVSQEGINFISRNREAISNFAAISPVPEYDTLKIAQDKWLLYQFLEQQELPTIPSVFVGTAGQLVENPERLASFEYPALLKPACGSGGGGIAKVETVSDFQRVWESEHIRKGQQYLLQSFIPSEEWSLSVLAEHGEIKAYTLYRSLLAPKKGFHIGRLLEYVDEESVLDVGARLVSAMQWHGVADIDILVDMRDQRPKILEVNPRFWRSLLGGLSAGVNFPLICCQSALGEAPFSKQRTPVRFARPSLYLEVLFSRLIG